MGSLFLSLPSIPYPGYYLTDTWMIVGWNILIVVLSIILFYWFRYGGTLSHDDKPEGYDSYGCEGGYLLLVLQYQIYVPWKRYIKIHCALSTLPLKRILMML